MADARCTILEDADGSLACVYSYSFEGKSYHRPAEWTDEGFDAAWLAVALDVTRPEDHRKQAIDALLEAAHDSHEYDCAD